MRSKLLLVALTLSTAAQVGTAQNTVNYNVTAIGSGASGDFAPYFIGSMNGGRIVRKGHALADLSATVELDSARRFSWAAGAEIITGYSTANDYQRWNGDWTTEVNRPSAIWIQQLYGQLKYRGVQLTIGQRDAKSAILPQELTSGDLTRSGNARGVPGASIGFIDFQNIPFTKGWVQIDGVVEYGCFYFENDFRKKQFNYYTGLLTGNTMYTYKRCFFRTKPSERFSVTLGMQTAGQFGGWTHFYRKGTMYRTDGRGFRIGDFFKMFFPTEGNGNNFYEGNSLGTWDFKARYRLNGGRELAFAFQWPWEDGSGIGHRNGWDGLYGLYYTSGRKELISGAAVEWIDFRNQSGPIHWEPNDFPNTTLTAHTSGGDNYYNNDTYASYTNYGMSIGSPIPVSPIYNLNGCSYFLHNCARGLHLALTGYIMRDLQYSVKYSWQQGWGMGRKPQPNCMIDNSMLADLRWDASSLAEGWKFGAQLAFDAGRLRGNNFGALVSVTYSGNFKFRK